MSDNQDSFCETMTRQPLVEILLATFRGADRLRQQLDSLVDQTYSNWQLIIRDDQSDDGTMGVIETFASENPGKVLIVRDTSERLGPAGNFARLLACAKADYVMFCDQDDVWLPEKVRLTLEKMMEVEGAPGSVQPVLVHSDLRVVDRDSVVIAESLWKHQNIHPRNRETLNRLLVQNVVTGCTVMLNKPLRELALPIPEDAVMHDWWLALAAAAFGRIAHVEQPTMLYRQHRDNQIGAKDWGFSFVLKNMSGNNGSVRRGILNAQRQAYAFLVRFQNKLSDDKREIVETYAKIDQQPPISKIYLLLKHRLFKAGLIRNMGLWAHI